jgi:hypothetical protein
VYQNIRPTPKRRSLRFLASVPNTLPSLEAMPRSVVTSVRCPRGTRIRPRAAGHDTSVAQSGLRPSP